jgi:hypothetical protein
MNKPLKLRRKRLQQRLMNLMSNHLLQIQKLKLINLSTCKIFLKQLRMLKLLLSLDFKSLMVSILLKNYSTER